MLLRSAERILVVPFADGIGDFVMMLPLLAAVRERYPAAAVTVAASARSALLLPENQPPPLAIRTPSWLRGAPRARGGALRKLVPQAAVASVAGVALQLELGRFDRTLNLFHWWERGVDFQRYWTPYVPARPGAVHTLDYLAGRLAAEIGVPIPPARRLPHVAVRSAAAAWARQWWQESGVARQAGAPGPVVALVPASNMRIKRWPGERWARLCAALAARGYVPLVVLPPGHDPVERHLSGIPIPPLTLRAPLDAVAAVLARCRLVVGVDTGLLHLAAAVGTRYVGLFGPTNPEVTGPYQRDLGTVLVAPFEKSDACCTCWRQFKYIDDRCDATAPSSGGSVGAGESCMASLSVAAVLAACETELAAARAAA